VGVHHWKTFLNIITFGLFFKETQTVTITAQDNSGTAMIWYYRSSEPLSLEQMDSLDWQTYSGAFSVNPNDGKFIVYAKISDPSGNTEYICSDGMDFEEENSSTMSDFTGTPPPDTTALPSTTEPPSSTSESDLTTVSDYTTELSTSESDLTTASDYTTEPPTSTSESDTTTTNQIWTTSNPVTTTSAPDTTA
jgi:hypothetical protein